MARKKVSTTVYLEATQLAALQALQQQTKVPMAEYIRQGVDLVLAKVATATGDVPGVTEDLGYAGPHTPASAIGATDARDDAEPA